jgi:hypothetical protein
MKTRALLPTALVTTRQPIIERLNKDLHKLLSSEDVKKQLIDAGGRAALELLSGRYVVMAVAIRHWLST